MSTEVIDMKTDVQKRRPAKRSFEDSLLWQIKLRLQFSGWLLYLAHAFIVVFFLIIAGIGWLIGYWPLLLVSLPLGLAAFFFVALVGTIVTVRYGLHPAERLPKPMTDLDVFDLMRVRRSCRSFQTRNLTEEHRTELLDVAKTQSSPEFLIGDHPIRLEYVSAPLTVWPVVGAREFLVAIAPKTYHRIAVIDVGRSLQKTVLHATRMGLATCWIGPGADQNSVIKHLGDRFDPAQDHVICVCAIGYKSMFKPLAVRAMRRFQHQRLPLSELFFQDPTYTRPLDVNVDPFRAYRRCFEVCQWSPSSYNSQTTRCAAVTAQVSGKDKLIRFDFAASTSSRYYADVALGIWCANWEVGCEALGKPGQFEVIVADAQSAEITPDLPHYDLSWVLD
jgi:nitroreductase